MTNYTQARHFLTARDAPDRLSPQPTLVFHEKREVGDIFVDPTKRFQTIEGFGGAFTEAAAVTLQKLGPVNRERVLRACFDRHEGHGYSLCRTHINSCDFALGNYAYDETPGDFELKHFSIERDQRALLPMIQDAQRIAGAPLKLFASPWSPPAWMKTTGQMNHGGKLKPDCRDAWARYFVRYVQEYAKAGVAIWGVTVQNEPEAKQIWDSCIYTPEEERDFVRDHLGPALERAGLGNVKIIIWDHNRDRIVERVQPAFDDPAASRYIWGAGFHWYVADKFENIQLVHDTWPDRKLLFTEGCQEGGPHTGEWALGERYARSIIRDLNHWTVGWVDWNLVLDTSGGPNHVGNFCSAPILADTEKDELLFQSSYYYLGHFSRFIRPGARRILCATTRDDLEATAFVNPDDTVAVVVLNRTDKEQQFSLRLPAGGAASAIPARSISTFVLT
ncbi:MAG TPA: glycoside hydrolase family 30 protein [Candidatus Limnocylindrales bacterium]|nr:glycoside hydrolase family 30 protein [Candidatus Limnocylindrales bacterium]